MLQRPGGAPGRGLADLGRVEREHDVGGEAVVGAELADHDVRVGVELAAEPAAGSVGPVAGGGRVGCAGGGEQDGRDREQGDGCEQSSAPAAGGGSGVVEHG